MSPEFVLERATDYRLSAITLALLEDSGWCEQAMSLP